MIGVITYNLPHRKTLDVLMLLKARGYREVFIYAVDHHYVKRFQPLVKHRPELINNNYTLSDLCDNLDFKYVNGNNNYNSLCNYIETNSKILVCGAGIIPSDIIKKYIFINSHPGYIPDVRGLDAFKWAILNKNFIGVTSHIIGDEVDAGYIIERKLVPIYKMDSFHSVAQRQYEMEIDMLVNAINLVDKNQLEYIQGGQNLVNKRMPHELELNILSLFEEYKNDYFDKKNVKDTVGGR